MDTTGPKQKLLIADGLDSAGKDKLKEVGLVELLDASGSSREELLKLISNVDILIVRSRTKVDREFLEHTENLKLVVRAGIGLDNIDVKTATERGVVVMNAPTGNTVTTAEHALALMFAISRRVAQADASIRKGLWEKKKFQGSQLGGKTLGVIGLGNIGKTIAKQALGLGMRVLGHDPYVNEAAAAKIGITVKPLDELLENADYITLHVPLTENTRHLIGRDAFQKMKRKPYLINCARGGVVDEAALEEALEKGLVSGCALDVFEKEPPPADHPLLKRDNVTATPHLGASTSEAQVQVGLEVADQIVQYLRDGIFVNAVNVPNLSREQLQVMKPYLTLCERLGSFLGQISPKKVERIRVHFKGSISKSYNPVLTISVLKGYLTPLLSAAVNFVNARDLVKERGIGVEESFDEECANFSSLISVTVEGDETISCSGSIFGKEEPRIVTINDIRIDALPAGHLLFTRNEDHPGVIGTMGTALGLEGINISRMALGLNKEKGQAIALINVDSSVPNEILQKLRNSKGMISVQRIEF